MILINIDVSRNQVIASQISINNLHVIVRYTKSTLAWKWWYRVFEQVRWAIGGIYTILVRHAWTGPWIYISREIGVTRTQWLRVFAFTRVAIIERVRLEQRSHGRRASRVRLVKFFGQRIWRSHDPVKLRDHPTRPIPDGDVPTLTAIKPTIRGRKVEGALIWRESRDVWSTSATWSWKSEFLVRRVGNVWNVTMNKMMVI